MESIDEEPFRLSPFTPREKLISGRKASHNLSYIDTILIQG
jgi:hypothetical protein